MTSSEPPQAPAPPSVPEKQRDGGVVPLAAGGFILFLNALTQPDWRIALVAFLFSFVGLLTARGWRQRALGVALSGLTGAICLISFLLER